MIKTTELVDHLVDHFRTGYAFLHLWGPEQARYARAVLAAAKRIGELRGEGPPAVLYWDLLSGFSAHYAHDLGESRNVTGLVGALQAGLSEETGPETLAMFGEGGPANDAVIVLKNLEAALHHPSSGPAAIEAIRTIIQGGLNGVVHDPDDPETVRRGQRMFVILTPTDRVPVTLPELHPERVALPDEAEHRETVDFLIDDHLRAEGDHPLKEESLREAAARACCGLTTIEAENALALALLKSRPHAEDPGRFREELIGAVEREKSVAVASIPGLAYLSRRENDAGELIGWEAAYRFFRERSSVPEQSLRRRGMRGLKGVALVGPPGVGKTVSAKAIARLLDRPLLIWNIGQSKSKYVGDSESRTAAVLDMAHAMRAVLMIDDLDKGSLGQGGGTRHDGDSGTTGNILNAVLTAASDPQYRGLFLYTLNRVQNVPGELLRRGRVDEVFYVELPDAESRAAILRSHIGRRAFEVTGEVEAAITRAAAATEHWSPAELESVVEGLAYPSDAGGRFLHERLDAAVADFVPLADQAAFKADLQEMQVLARNFRRIGNLPESPADAGERPAGGRPARRPGRNIR